MFNLTRTEWNPGCFLINDFEGGLQKNFFEIKDSVSPSYMFFLEIQMKIPKKYSQTDEIKVQFQFVTKSLRPFGQRMIARVNILPEI